MVRHGECCGTLRCHRARDGRRATVNAAARCAATPRPNLLAPDCGSPTFADLEPRRGPFGPVG
eukprot:7850971-Alexandrium_andersonii.AAC.1